MIIIKNYKIIKLNNSEYKYLILSTNYQHLLDSIDEISTELEIGKYRIIFDLLLCNGHNNRFIEGLFEIHKFNLMKFNMIHNIDISILKISNSFYKKNKTLLNNSVLSDSEKYILLNN